MIFKRILTKIHKNFFIKFFITGILLKNTKLNPKIIIGKIITPITLLINKLKIGILLKYTAKTGFKKIVIEIVKKSAFKTLFLNLKLIE